MIFREHPEALAKTRAPRDRRVERQAGIPVVWCSRLVASLFRMVVHDVHPY